MEEGVGFEEGKLPVRDRRWRAAEDRQPYGSEREMCPPRWAPGNLTPETGNLQYAVAVPDARMDFPPTETAKEACY